MNSTPEMLQPYLLPALIFVGSLVFTKLLQSVVTLRLKHISQKTTNPYDDLLIDIISSISSIYLLYSSFFVSSLFFPNIPDTYSQILTGIFIGFSIFETIKALDKLINFTSQNFLQKQNKASDPAIVGVIKIGLKIGLWTVGILLFLSNMGVDITSLIAGLGVGGVAVALAVQNILSDLLSSLAIYFDKPFRPGDFIIFEGNMGTVKKIGIKTTRIHALSGEEIVVPNQTLTSTSINNYKNLKKRRVVFNLGVNYHTKPEKLEKIPQIIKHIITSIDQTEFDRAHFNAFNDSSLSFEIVYHVTTSDYDRYMDIQQQINLAIVNKFNHEKIDLAFPTRTIHLIK